MKKILVLFGTRPEVIKLFPVIAALREDADAFDVRVISTGQHREMLEHTLADFGLAPDRHLDVMTAGQDLFDISVRVLDGLCAIYREESPDLVVCQGDTTTTFISALAAFYMRIVVAHVEAGLRSGDIFNPYPEEANRRAVSIFADHNFAPTEQAAQNLLAEGVPADRVFVTGNTVIDALYHVVAQDNPLPKELAVSSSKKLVLITFHRRESFGKPIKEMCAAVRELALAHPDVQWVFPVHLNPNVRNIVFGALEYLDNVRLVNPQPYSTFVTLLARAHLVLSDSGGVQEEATALGKPVLVLRDKTERPEVMSAGNGRLIGVKKDEIIKHSTELLAGGESYRKMANRSTVFGDGTAAKQITAILKKELAG
jgi:UDP-N-acetylglucosamine 2-epimerase (non-hydrolysing)